MSKEPARDAIDTVRAFNRTVTSRIGALEDHYLVSALSQAVRDGQAKRARAQHGRPSHVVALACCRSW